MKKAQTSQVVKIQNPKTKKRRQSLIALVIFLISIIGLSSAFFLQKNSQDTRNQASVAGGLVSYTLVPQVFEANSNRAKIDVYINTNQAGIDAFQFKLDLPKDSLTDLSFVSEELEKTKEVKNLVSDNSITAAWVLDDVKVPFQTNENIKIGSIYFNVTPQNNTEAIAFNWDQSFSKATIYKTGVDSLKTPDSFSLPLPESNNQIGGKPVIKSVLCQSDSECGPGEICSSTPAGGCPSTVGPNGTMMTTSCAQAPTCMQAEGINCQTNDDCFKGYNCYQPPMPEFSGGESGELSRAAVMPAKICTKKIAYVSETPTPTPTILVGEPRNICQSDSECAAGEVCSATPAGGCPSTTTADGITITSSCARPPTCMQAEGIPCEPNKYATAPGESDDCFKGYSCYPQPLPSCPEGQVCPTTSRAIYTCKKTIAYLSETPTPTPTKSIEYISKTPTPTKTYEKRVICSPPKPCPQGAIAKLIYDENGCSQFICQASTCEMSYSPWSECKNGLQERTLNPSGDNCYSRGEVVMRRCVTGCNADSQCQSGEYCDFKVVAYDMPTTDMNGICKTKPQEILLADFNKDGKVDALDLSRLLSSLYGADLSTDINKDGAVDVTDYSLLIKALLDNDILIGTPVGNGTPVSETRPYYTDLVKEPATPLGDILKEN